MKVLAVDAGNSRIKWGLHDGSGWVAQSWVITAEAGQLGESWSKLPPPGALIASNVAGDAVGKALRIAAQRLDARLEVIASRAQQCGVRSSYDDPAQLGPDRWAALIGAWHLWGGPSVVVNAGTTMTADALSRDGVFLGGVIVAGVDLMRDALARSTAGLTLHDGHYTFFPATTADAIMSGAINALAGTIERMQRFMREAGEAEPRVVLSGGAAPGVEHALNGSVEVVDNLVLEGLLRIALDAKA
ncbi:MAG: type III pantothenate kinase [Betaproteobacteria bacterium]|nr:type III pantothenate kinase [Betaproteobacteria bacterium]